MNKRQRHFSPRGRESYQKISFGGAAVYIILTILAGLWAAGCGGEKADDSPEAEYEIDQKYERGPLTVYVKVDKSEISISDTIRLHLEALIDQGYEVDMPPLAEALGKYELGILDYKSQPDKLGDKDRLLIQRDYRLEPIVSGSFTIPALKFIFREKGMSADSSEGPRQYELLTEEIPIEVTSLLDEERGDLTIADIKEAASMPRGKSYWWVWLGGGGVVLGGIVTALILIMGRRKVKQIRILTTAHQLAYERLEKLIGEDLTGQGRIKEFYERISNILRWYIEHRFNLKAPERTTEEFLAELPTTKVLSGTDQERLAELLTHCDLVKFAKYSPTTEQIQKTFDLVKDFIETTKSQEKKIDVTESDSGNVELRSA